MSAINDETQMKMVLGPYVDPDQPALRRAEDQLKGGLVNYYLVHVSHPQRGGPGYQAECEDIIDALDMTFDEANIFKAIWRTAAARQGNGKPNQKALYDAQKVVHYANRMLRRTERLTGL